MIDFKELRTKIGLTQAELAKKVDVSVNTIQNWESRKTLPKGDKMNQYLKALEITDQVLIKRIMSDIAAASYIEEVAAVDNVPYCLFPDGSEQIDKIKNCFASAEELDMLGYAYYVSSNGKHAQMEKRREEHFILEFAFFEKYGGYNVTMKRLHDAGKRLGALRLDAIEFAEQNPGCEYRLTSIEKEKIIDKLGILFRITNYQKQIKEIYDLLKTIESSVDMPHSPKHMGTIMQLTRRVNALLQNSHDRISGKRNFGVLEGYISLKDDSQENPNLSMVELTERGRMLIEMVEGNEYINRNAVLL
ncbi:MAG: helix-turn-helix transcriptional regulator [Lachnospiraceae bacterium]|jgi:transcriptional regulator with XRE-family HTH domain|nr:helix-turn-helix transcriptional regulator [Lachnospiraceae bacterium]